MNKTRRTKNTHPRHHICFVFCPCHSRKIKKKNQVSLLFLTSAKMNSIEPFSKPGEKKTNRTFDKNLIIFLNRNITNISWQDLTVSWTSVQGIQHSLNLKRKNVMSWWALMGLGGFWWLLVGLDGLWWALMGIDGAWVDFDGVWWALMGLDGVWWVFFKKNGLPWIFHTLPGHAVWWCCRPWRILGSVRPAAAADIPARSADCRSTADVAAVQSPLADTWSLWNSQSEKQHKYHQRATPKNGGGGKRGGGKFSQ